MRRPLAAALAAIAALAVGVGLPATGAGAGSLRPHSGIGGPEIFVGRSELGVLSKYVFGANLLWAFDAEGAFNPATDSWYQGFVSMLRRLKLTALRYPAGTTSDSFDWLRAIGPQAERQPNEPYGMQAAALSKVCCVVDSPIPSTVGPDEFGRLLGATGAVGNIVVNFATGTVRQAADFVAYMTAPLGGPLSNPADPGYWAALRAANGHPAPYDVPYWEVGNEQSFPGQYGWRSGRLVDLGPHSVPCPPGEAPTCLYAFGGTTAFTDEPVGTFADDLPASSYSTGAPGQTFYVYFPPVVPRSVTVYVGGRPWTEVASLAGAGPGSHVYTLDVATGTIVFGNGVHGAVPPAGVLVTACYESGPHGGFVEFYRAMKAMGPKAQICETEESNVVFLQLMGRAYPYDCVELHLYARPTDIGAPLTAYEEQLMAYPPREVASLERLQREVRLYSGRQVPVVVTEYGQLVKPMPRADRNFNLTLDEGLLVAVQLMELASHHVVLAEKYLIDSAPFSNDQAPAGLSIDSALVAGPGPRFVAEPSGDAIALLSRLAGAELLPTVTLDAPTMGARGRVRSLWALAAISRKGSLELAVVNADPLQGTRVDVVLAGKPRIGDVKATVLDGPTAATYNTPTWPDLVGTRASSSSSAAAGPGRFNWYFPAHSLTLLVVPLASSRP